MRLRLTLLACLAFVIGAVWTAPASASIPTMTVSELEPGMQGVCRTVIRGTEIREFECEIIDVFANMGFNHGPLILLRIWGDAVDESGGIAGGYSGSPVFIDGKLIGALSWGPYFTEGDVVGATPIHEMLRALTYPEEEAPRISSSPAELREPIQVAGREFNRVLLAQNQRDGADLEAAYGGDTLVMTPCRTPLIVSGLSEQGYARLREFAEERLPYMDLVMGPGGGTSDGVPILLGPTVLEPGASVGAQLASGDLDLTAVGTLTWVDDDGRFLAFGHPFLADGLTNLPFVTTRIVYTMPALDRSYKLGEPIEVVGTVTQDRLTAIGGTLRETPDMVEFNLTVIDHDIDRTQRYNYSVINKEDWLAFLGWLMPMEGLLYGSDRAGHGTCRVSFSIHGEGLARPIERENLFYAGYGLHESLNEFYEALNMLTLGNPYREVRLTRVDIEVETTSARQTMEILRARFQNAPNMGPGAIGYTGPGELDDKEAKDEEVGTSEPFDYMPPENIQDMPMEELEAYMQSMEGMEQYVDEYTPTTLVGYHQGDTIELLVTLRPYREDPIEKVVEIEIPEDFPPGQTSVEIYGGVSYGLYSSYYYMGAGTEDYYYGGYMYMPPEDLDEIIEEFEKRETGNTIIARLLTMGPDDPYYYLQDEYEAPEEIKAVLETEDIVYGWYSLPVEILGEDTAEVTDTMMPEGDLSEYMEPVEEQQESRSRNPHRH